MSKCTRRKHITSGGLTLLCGVFTLTGCDGELNQRVLFGGEEVQEMMGGESSGGGGSQMPGQEPVIERPDEEVINPSMMDDVCKVINPGDAPMMRLTEQEYRGATAAIFPDLAVQFAADVADEKVGPFNANVSVPVETLHAEHYQDNAERVANAVIEDFSGRVACATSQAEALPRVEAESLMGTVGRGEADSWLLWSNGEVATTMTLEHGGEYTMTVRAWGSQAGTDLPKMRVLLDREEVALFDVDALRDNPKTYTLSFESDPGVKEVVVQFTNDFNEDGNDRNLWVDYIDLTANEVTRVEESCAREFITDFGKKAWRRPLSSTDVDRFFSLYQTIATSQGPREGIRAVVEAGLQSPHFLYRSEFEQALTASEPIIKLGSYELASRLAFFLWDAGPDEELLAAAEAGELETIAQIEAQTRRMLQDPRARKVLTYAVAQMLGLDKLFAYNKEDARYTSEVRQALYDEALALIEHIIWEEGGDLDSLITANYAFVSKQTAFVYGITLDNGQGENGELVRVELGPERAGGMLTHPAVLARHGYGQMNVHRGLFIREFFFCDRPAPPPDELVNPPMTFEGQSDRSKGEGRLMHPGCQYCHQHMDVIGNAFDTFDEIGRVRTQDKFGNDVFATGELMHTAADDQSFEGASALASIMAESEQVRSCVSSQWLRYAMGRYLNTDSDACTVHVLEEASKSADGNIPEMFVAITTTDAFRYLRTSQQ